ncbi:MAG: thioredoxin fold domain-containing protein, partial [Salinisphaeraceae bacterium]|nr:thioredoxin fold domain-containing protein [Salinisphaeraceae bacterium]
CSEDQQAAMDEAKQGRSVGRETCENPVETQYNLGRQVGVTGTPASVLENGQIVPGYRPAEKMAEVLELL